MAESANKLSQSESACRTEGVLVLRHLVGGRQLPAKCRTIITVRLGRSYIRAKFCTRMTLKWKLYQYIH